MRHIETYILLAILLLALGYLLFKGFRNWRRLSDAKASESCGYSCDSCPFGQKTSSTCRDVVGSNDEAMSSLSPEQELAASEDEKQSLAAKDKSESTTEVKQKREETLDSDTSSEQQSAEDLSKSVLGQMIKNKK